MLSTSTLAKEVPLQDFIKRGDFLNIEISPDGQHVAARVRDNDTVYMLTMRLSDGKIVGGVRPGNKDMVASVRWVSNERLIYTYAEKTHHLDQAVGTGELYAINVDASGHIMLAGYRADDRKAGTRLATRKPSYATHRVISKLVGDDDRVLIVEHPWTLRGSRYYNDRTKNPVVVKLNINTGKKSDKELIPYPGARVFADENGNVNFLTWSDKNDKQHAFYRTSKKDDWEEITDVFGDQLNGLTATGVSNDGQTVFLDGQTKNDIADTVYRFDLKTRELTKLFDNEIDLYAWEVDTNNQPYVGVSFPDDIQYHYSNAPSTQAAVKWHKSLVKAFKGQRIWLNNQTNDAKRITLQVENSTNPGEFYIFDTDTKKANFVWANYSWIDPRDMLPKAPISFKARDGQLIHGYLTMPNREAGAPLVVLPHGGPHGVRDYPFFEYEVQLLANRGYAVLQVNFRGSGGYNHTFQELGYQNWGRVMIDDIIDGTKWLLGNDKVDDQRVCIYGASYGGYAAMMSAIKAPDLFNCAIGYVGVYDLEAMKSKGDIPTFYSGSGYLSRALGDDIESMRSQSPVNLSDKLKAKVLLIHGDEDIRAPSYHSKAMRKALKRSGNAPEWLYLGDVGHGAVSLKNRTKVYTKLLKFLDKNIGSK